MTNLFARPVRTALQVRCDGHRKAFSLIEMTIVASILAIGSAVVLPRWSRSLERSKVQGMRQSVEADVDVLRRVCVRRGQKINLTFSVEGSTMTITPALPGVLGDPSGVINYAPRFSGSSFSAADLNGNATCDINMYGELVSVYTGQPLTAGLITVSNHTNSQSSDLLVHQGQTSSATVPGQEEQPPPQAMASTTAPPASQTTASTTTTTTKSLLSKLLGW